MNKESVYILLISCLVVFYSCEKRGETHKPSIMVVTHDTDFATKTDRIITMEDGYVINEGR